MARRPGNPTINETNKATRIKPGQALPGAGRRPSKIKAFARENELTAADIKNALSLVVDMTEGELRDLIVNKDESFLVRGFARAFVDDFKKASLSNTETLLTRLFGAPKQSLETTGRIEIKIGKEFEGL